MKNPRNAHFKSDTYPFNCFSVLCGNLNNAWGILKCLPSTTPSRHCWFIAWPFCCCSMCPSSWFIEHIHKSFLILRNKLQESRICLSNLLQYCIQELRICLNNLSHLLKLWLWPQKCQRFICNKIRIFYRWVASFSHSNRDTVIDQGNSQHLQGMMEGLDLGQHHLGHLPEE